MYILQLKNVGLIFANVLLQVHYFVFCYLDIEVTFHVKQFRDLKCTARRSKNNSFYSCISIT